MSRADARRSIMAVCARVARVKAAPAWSGGVDDVDADLDGKGRTAAFFCAQYGRLAALRVLMHECGADANKGDARGWTPLMIAAFHGQAGACRFLLDEGDADVAQAAPKPRTSPRARRRSTPRARRSTRSWRRCCAARGACRTRSRSGAWPT